jgi:hypothetical protein
MVRFAAAVTALLFTASTVDAATGVRGKDVADERDLRRSVRSLRCVMFCIYGLKNALANVKTNPFFA